MLGETEVRQDTIRDSLHLLRRDRVVGVEADREVVDRGANACIPVGGALHEQRGELGVVGPEVPPGGPGNALALLPGATVQEVAGEGSEAPAAGCLGDQRAILDGLRRRPSITCRASAQCSSRAACTRLASAASWPACARRASWSRLRPIRASSETRGTVTASCRAFGIEPSAVSRMKRAGVWPQAWARAVMRASSVGWNRISLAAVRRSGIPVSRGRRG